MAINGKQKGSDFERVVAKSWTKWIQKFKGCEKMEFNRVPASGGLRWKQDNNVTGDIVPPPKFMYNRKSVYFPWNLECKKVEVSWDIDRFLLGTMEFWDWWKQSCDDCERLMKQGTKKHPTVIFSKNRRSVYIAMSYTLYTLIVGELKSLNCMHIENPDKTEHVVLVDFNRMLEILVLEDVLKTYDVRYS